MVREDGETEMVTTTTVTAGLSPQHKAAIVLFLERVYGVQDQITFYRLLENGFLPDLRAATTLEEVSIGTTVFRIRADADQRRLTGSSSLIW